MIPCTNWESLLTSLFLQLKHQILFSPQKVFSNTNSNYMPHSPLHEGMVTLALISFEIYLRSQKAKILLLWFQRCKAWEPIALGNGDATSPSNDPLQGIGGPTTRSKIKWMKQALPGLVLKIKEKEDQRELRVAPNWFTLLQIDEDALRPTWRITLGSPTYKTRRINGLR